MKLCDINPFLRYAKLQPSVMSSAPLSCAYDYRLFYILEGTAFLVFSDRRVPVFSGMLIYLRPGTPYYFDGKVKVIVLNFDMTRAHADQRAPLTPARSDSEFDPTRIFEADPPEELRETVIIEKAFEAESRLQKCLLHHNCPSDLSDAMTSAIIKNLLCYVVQQTADQRPTLSNAVQRAMLYIQQNYDKEISNDHISGVLGYHSFYLNRIFKKSTGMTIHQSVINERMRIAKYLLAETDLSVSAIASEVGYAEHARFSTAFKRYAGIAPLQYRTKRTSLATQADAKKA